PAAGTLPPPAIGTTLGRPALDARNLSPFTCRYPERSGYSAQGGLEPSGRKVSQSPMQLVQAAAFPLKRRYTRSSSIAPTTARAKLIHPPSLRWSRVPT